MSWDRYLSLSWYDRWVMHEELSEQIELTNPPPNGDEGGGVSPRPKGLRR